MYQKKRENLKKNHQSVAQNHLDQLDLETREYFNDEPMDLKFMESNLGVHRSCHSATLEIYVKNRQRYLQITGNIYTDLQFRVYNWHASISRARAESKMVKEIKKQFTNDAILIMGDASIQPSMRHFISTPNIRLKRMLKTHFVVMQIDEFRTSAINNRTLEYKSGNMHFRDARGKLRKLHAVLTYKTFHGTLGAINRDSNAVDNNILLFRHYLRYLRDEEENPRPMQFLRSTKKDDIHAWMNAGGQHWGRMEAWADRRNLN